ncbi:inosine triphosphate pyrophosphatase-like protein [Crepidotus variabilis]|uniref:Inosine triphosphate pyrophosphatase n=1 Tax=Crepidotus variabilis TaxID=179855 RepID=A0A9P6ETD5_9AGAR|nr:inosine triphosphate pyrophosphatase-like protein [Crepidotus variabilis]
MSNTTPLVFVTGNANKLREVKDILSQGGNSIEIESRSLDIPEIQGTTIEVAQAKCRRAAELINGPCITEDTALCYEALNGLPGPYIKQFMAEIGHDGLNKLLVGFDSKKAEAVCTFAYAAGAASEPIIFEGRTEGTIVCPRGPKVFGWDAVFQPLGYDQTYAEMPSEEKNKISHRGKALEKLKAYLRAL